MEYVSAGYQTFGLRIVVVLLSEDYMFGPKIHHFALVHAQSIVTILSDNLENVCARKVVIRGGIWNLIEPPGAPLFDTRNVAGEWAMSSLPPSQTVEAARVLCTSLFVILTW